MFPSNFVDLLPPDKNDNTPDKPQNGIDNNREMIKNHINSSNSNIPGKHINVISFSKLKLKF